MLTVRLVPHQRFPNGILTIIKLNDVSLGTLLGISFSVYVLWVVWWRLYRSPLAQFPGPTLAALSRWYEVYFELFLGEGGQFVFEIARLHQM